jgi:hypothetical protein
MGSVGSTGVSAWRVALVAALLLRALVPAGFMPAAGSLALVFCEPGAFAPHAHHAHHGGHGVAAECPFAQSAGPALPTLALAPPAHPLVSHVPAVGREPGARCDAPLRYAAARGPPALS